MVDQHQSQTEHNFIFCSTGREAYGIEAARIENIERLDNLQHAPGENGQIGSFSTSNGDIPVFDLGLILGRKATAKGSSQRVVVVRAGPKPWAMLVHSVSPVAEVAANQVDTMPRIAINPAANYFGGVIKYQGHLVLALALDRLHPAARLALDAPAKGTTAADWAASVAVEVPPQASPGVNGDHLDDAVRSIVLFSAASKSTVSGVAFGLSFSQVSEVLNIPAIIPVPMAPDHLLGLTNWRNQVVPIVDLHATMGLSNQAGLIGRGQSQLMVVRGTKRDTLLGFPIHPSVRSVRLPVEYRPCERTLPLIPQHVRGVYDIENETLVVPDIGRVIG